MIGAGQAEGHTAEHADEDAVAVYVNGEPREVRPGTTVEDVVCLMAPERRGIAVAVSGDIVPRSSWATTVLAMGDQLEVLTAAQGG
ncbi:MAG TPA: sulfur carrier protein ThiS [Acidimicrobiales bacterium]|nr:sulfur carrier protein ThiS [Acidimicrobiales bacterium]